MSLYRSLFLKLLKAMTSKLDELLKTSIAMHIINKLKNNKTAFCRLGNHSWYRTEYLYIKNLQQKTMWKPRTNTWLTEHNTTISLWRKEMQIKTQHIVIHHFCLKKMLKDIRIQFLWAWADIIPWHNSDLLGKWFDNF